MYGGGEVYMRSQPSRRPHLLRLLWPLPATDPHAPTHSDAHRRVVTSPLRHLPPRRAVLKGANDTLVWWYPEVPSVFRILIC